MREKRGRLIAVDGFAGAPLTAAARTLARSLQESTGCAGVSGWDASGIFSELTADDSDVTAASARTLTLLYAADLAFRVRWHITPALAAGELVVAAPYVETAKALAIAAGVPGKWLDELFAFAPKPSICYRVDARAPRRATSGRSSYQEWFTRIVSANGPGIEPKRLRAGSAEYLKSLEARRRCRPLTRSEMNRLIGATSPKP